MYIPQQKLTLVIVLVDEVGKLLVTHILVAILLTCRYTCTGIIVLNCTCKLKTLFNKSQSCNNFCGLNCSRLLLFQLQNCNASATSVCLLLWVATMQVEYRTSCNADWCFCYIMYPHNCGIDTLQCPIVKHFTIYVRISHYNNHVCRL